MVIKKLGDVHQLYLSREARATELAKQGSKIFGYFCCLTPVEILTAADIVPYRIMGNIKQNITEADIYLEKIACPFIRSCLNMALIGEYHFLDGFVVPHGCDNIVKIYDIWKDNVKPVYAHFINVPHTLSKPSKRFFRAELSTFKSSLEEFIKKEITVDRLQDSINLHNKNRALLRELYELRRPDPPLISGGEILEILVDTMSLPVQESCTLLSNIIDQVKRRKENSPKKRARLLIYGCEVDDTHLMKMIESSGANVVIDDLGIGTRSFWRDVEKSEDPLGNLVNHYLGNVPCPRFFKGGEDTYENDLEIRFGYLLNYAKEFNVDGVIVHLTRFCDIFAFDFPDVRDFFQNAGIPVISIEDDYTTTSMERLRTRLQAFVEMLQNK